MVVLCFDLKWCFFGWIIFYYCDYNFATGEKSFIIYFSFIFGKMFGNKSTTLKSNISLSSCVCAHTLDQGNKIDVPLTLLLVSRILITNSEFNSEFGDPKVSNFCLLICLWVYHLHEWLVHLAHCVYNAILLLLQCKSPISVCVWVKANWSWLKSTEYPSPWTRRQGSSPSTHCSNQLEKQGARARSKIFCLSWYPIYFHLENGFVNISQTAFPDHPLI